MYPFFRESKCHGLLLLGMGWPMLLCTHSNVPTGNSAILQQLVLKMYVRCTCYFPRLSVKRNLFNKRSWLCPLLVEVSITWIRITLVYLKNLTQELSHSTVRVEQPCAAAGHGVWAGQEYASIMPASSFLFVNHPPPRLHNTLVHTFSPSISDLRTCPIPVILYQRAYSSTEPNSTFICCWTSPLETTSLLCAPTLKGPNNANVYIKNCSEALLTWRQHWIAVGV